MPNKESPANKDDINNNNIENNKEINLFFPGKDFPSMSVTGTSCSLECEHCNNKYLSHMKDISNEKKLRENLDRLIKIGAQGCLISGGCDENGKVPILKFKEILKEYKANKGKEIILNLHIGLLNENEIKQIAEIPPDIVSFDFTLDEEIIHNVYHLENRSKLDYIETLDNLIKHKINIVPHICIGLNFGNIKKEIESLEYLQKYNFDLIVFIILIPPENNDKFSFADSKDIGEVLIKARSLFPNTELSLGCMRPRGKEHLDIEDIAIEAGINRFTLPSKKTMKKLEENGYKINSYNACCAIPLKLYKLYKEK
ncbi:MAG: hypothetical protein GY870_20215 [archaeon]|nr:hypothetical protein [archaeon]